MSRSNALDVSAPAVFRPVYISKLQCFTSRCSKTAKLPRLVALAQHSVLESPSDIYNRTTVQRGVRVTDAAPR